MIITFILVKYRNSISNLDITSRKQIVILAMVNIFGLVASILCGLPFQTQLFGLPFMFFLFFVIIKNNIIKVKKIHITKRNIQNIILVMFFLLLVSQFIGIGNYHTEFFNSQTKQANAIFLESRYVKENFGCYKGTIYEREHYEDLKKIRKYIEKSNRDFLIFGEYAFLYCDYDVLPDAGLPLWIHEGVTFSHDVGYPKIKQHVEKESPQLIIEQMIAPEGTRKDFHRHMLNIGYIQIDTLRGDLSHINIYYKKITQPLNNLPI